MIVKEGILVVVGGHSKFAPWIAPSDLLLAVAYSLADIWL